MWTCVIQVSPLVPGVVLKVRCSWRSLWAGRSGRPRATWSGWLGRHAAGSLPWATIVINVVGCALIGVLMVLVSEVWIQQRLLRPFLGTGVLGGFTTFSTYSVDIQQLVANGHPVTALSYLAATVIGAIAAVWAATHTTRALVGRR